MRTWNGFCYLAFILDCHSRMIVGWQLAPHMRAELVLDALEMANGLRRPRAGLIAHRQRLAIHQPHLHRPARRPRDRPLGRLEGRRLRKRDGRSLGRDPQERTRRRTPLPSFEHAEHETLHWISFYNGERLHEELGDLPPTEYEGLNYKRDNTETVSAR